MYGFKYHCVCRRQREGSASNPDTHCLIPHCPFFYYTLQGSIARHCLTLHRHFCDRTTDRFRTVCKPLNVLLYGPPVICHTTLRCHRISHYLICQWTEERIIQWLNVFCNLRESVTSGHQIHVIHGTFPAGSPPALECHYHGETSSRSEEHTSELQSRVDLVCR